MVIEETLKPLGHVSNGEQLSILLYLAVALVEHNRSEVRVRIAVAVDASSFSSLLVDDY